MANLGKDAKLYYGASGSTAATEFSAVQDLTLTMTKETVDTTSRASGGWGSRATTVKDAQLTFTLLWDSSDAGFTSLRNAFLNDTQVALLVLDEEAGEGLDADFDVSEFTREEPVRGVLTASVTCEVNADTRAPSWSS